MHSFVNKHFLKLLVVILFAINTQGCQKLATPTVKVDTTIKKAEKLVFNVNGKFALRYFVAGSGSSSQQQNMTAYYAWAQNGDNYIIDLAGAFNIGKSRLEGTNKQARFTSAMFGNGTATTPEKLLQNKTGWQAPLSELPYWVMGKPSKNNSNNQYDHKNRLVSSVAYSSVSGGTASAPWQVFLKYQSNYPLPYKLIMYQKNNNDNNKNPRVVMLINDTKPATNAEKRR